MIQPMSQEQYEYFKTFPDTIIVNYDRYIEERISMKELNEDGSGYAVFDFMSENVPLFLSFGGSGTTITTPVGLEEYVYLFPGSLKTLRNHLHLENVWKNNLLKD